MQPKHVRHAAASNGERPAGGRVYAAAKRTARDDGVEVGGIDAYRHAGAAPEQRAPLMARLVQCVVAALKQQPLLLR